MLLLARYARSAAIIILAKFLFCDFMDSHEVEVHKNEKRRGRYPAVLTEQAWSIKHLLYGQKLAQKSFAFAGTTRAIPSGQDRPILPARVGNQITGFSSFCSLGEPAI